MSSHKPFPFSDEQLDAAGLRGEGVSGNVIQVMKTMTEHPELLGDLSLFALQCVNHSGNLTSLSSPATSASSTFSDASTYVSTAVAPYGVSEWERVQYYNGISHDHPELLYRSDLVKNPFPIPTGRHRRPPTKTIHGVFNTPLNDVWDIVAPQIRDLLKNRKIRYSAIQTARFVTHGEDGKDTLGPIVIWIATHPFTTTPLDAHDASPEILALLGANGVQGAVIEWIEGAVGKLSGPPLLDVVHDTDPTHYVRRFLTAVLGMPITTAVREATDSQGSVALFFHENKDNNGNPSDRVFAVTNCHVLREDTTTAYQFRGAGAPRQYVRVAGLRRFQLGLDEIKTLIGGYTNDAERLAREIKELEANRESEDPVPAAKIKAEVEKRSKLTTKKNEIRELEAFHKEVHTHWSDISNRNIGHVHWAPEISVDVQGRRYTKDIGTFEVDKKRFRDNFRGNVVDLGVKFPSRELTNMFYPQSGGRTVFVFPNNGLLRIRGCVTRELLATPDCFASNGEPCLIVMKDGNTTGLTVGRYSGLEALLCDEFGVESIELAIYNYDNKSGPFSDKGDSGSLVFDGEGRMVGIMHSGLWKGSISHVTYATPAWWVIDQLKRQYPYADFNRETS